MAQSISALNATLPLFSSKSYKPKPSFSTIVSTASKTPVGTNLILTNRTPTTRNTQQVINDPLAYSYTIPGSYSSGRTPWEIREREKEYKMRFDMPGMRREDVKVWIEENNMLIVQAEKAQKTKTEQNNNSLEVQEQEEKEDEWSAKSFGRYRTVIALPENIQFEKIKAEVKDGVLYITIPKASVSAKVLNIPVQ